MKYKIDYIYITNDIKLARIANESCVDYVMVDLEIIGKLERQGHLNTLISRHDISDVSNVKKQLSSSKLLVRINPINLGSKDEIDSVITSGADAIMLPMFTSIREVQEFISLVDNRVETFLLFETPQALVKSDQILSMKGIDKAHLGLNDLHLAMGCDFMFELLSGGIVEAFANNCHKNNIKFGFGGIARLGQGAIDSKLILSEHVRLGSECVILSRDFHCQFLGDYAEYRSLFAQEMLNLANHVQYLSDCDRSYLLKNKEILNKRIYSVV
ncbi:Aldolase [Vibrio chagasii]|nr:Aldolase [Vibrio chagasii]CAH6905235.1 Aldolase [Vibrio chagasii]CAH6990998.1 Aldolase [Vibrio chagasii]CAH7014273.1 Aldolase [Vibrio chagasii]